MINSIPIIINHLSNWISIISFRDLSDYNQRSFQGIINYQIIDFESKEIIIPFDTTHNSTRMSTDSQGMFFNLHVESLPPGKIYQFQFLIKDKGNDQILENVAGKFKVENKHDSKHDLIDDDSLVS